MIPLCTHGSCDRRAYYSGFCRPHHEERSRQGKAGRVDSAPVVAHIRALQELGWTHRAIGEAAGLCPTTTMQMLRLKAPTTLAITANAVLKIEPKPYVSKRLVSGLATSRRLQALARLGWCFTDIGAEIGVSGQLISKWAGTATINYRATLLIKDVYERLSMALPPDDAITTRQRRLAESKMWPPPLAWDNIDDPNEKPKNNTTGIRGVDWVQVKAATSGELAYWKLGKTEKKAALRWLHEQGLTDRQMSVRLKANFGAIQRARIRAGLPANEQRLEWMPPGHSRRSAKHANEAREAA